MRQLFLLAAILVAWTTYGQPVGHALSLEDATTILQNNNNAIKISQKGIQAAQAQRQQLNSSWYPYITATGGYMHLSNDISAQADIGELAEQLIGELLPQLQQIISGISSTALNFPLLDQNIATFDAAAIWPIITGGKRIYANRIGKGLETSSRYLHTLTVNSQMVLMLNAYYTHKLSCDVVQMQQENLQYMEKLNYNAIRLKEEGFLNKAEYLVVEVALSNIKGELQSAIHNKEISHSALEAILGTETYFTELSGNWFTVDSIPNLSALCETILMHNAKLALLRQQVEILDNKKKIAQSNYFPNIALFAKQNLYSNNIPKNLAPPTIVGAAMQWDIFDGFSRENEILKSRIEQEQAICTIDQAESDLITAAIALRGKMADAKELIQTLKKSIALAQELLREREKSFIEGLCTTTDIVSAKTSITKANTALSLAYWEYCTSLANLLALSSDTYKFIELHNEYEQ